MVSSFPLVRFAPSPTGFLHVGNARIALINWLFCKQRQGTFLLRIDDTDQERSKKVYEEAIIEDIAWLGLTHDLFVKQSDRLPMYEEAKKKLIEEGRLYPCYETPEELEFKRRRQLGKGLPPIYDRGALELTQGQKEVYEKEGRKPHWRFKLNHETTCWDDLIRGTVSFEGHQISDPVLIKGDGQFLYMLCSVVDDLKDGVTHVIRGEDHVSNTVSQIQLLEAIGKVKNPVTFGHITLLTDHEGKGLSKREGSLSLRDLRDHHIDPMAINSLLARLGTSQPVEPISEMEVLIKTFDLNHFSRTAPRFNKKELESLSLKLLISKPFDEIKTILNSIKASKIEKKEWEIIAENITCISDILTWETVFYGDFPFVNVKEPQEGFFEKAINCLPLEPWGETTWANWTKALSDITNLKGKSLFMPLREALTGQSKGPEMAKLLPLINHKKCYERLSRII